MLKFAPVLCMCKISNVSHYSDFPVLQRIWPWDGLPAFLVIFSTLDSFKYVKTVLNVPPIEIQYDGNETIYGISWDGWRGAYEIDFNKIT